MSKRLFSPLKIKKPWDLQAFSLKLLDTEIELEKNFKTSTIEDLITLYSQAIEHYNEINDPKFYDYQDRLHRLLIKPEIASVLNGEKLHNLYSFTKRKSLQNQEIIRTKLNDLAKLTGKQKFHDEKNLEIRTEIIGNVLNQDLMLSDRINHRRLQKAHSPRDLGNVSTKNSSYLDEREQIEEIMERHYNEKSKAIEEVTLKYRLLLEDSTQAADNSEVLEEMKEEVKKVSQEYDNARIEELRRFKFSFKRQNTPKHC